MKKSVIKINQKSRIKKTFITHLTFLFVVLFVILGLFIYLSNKYQNGNFLTYLGGIVIILILFFGYLSFLLRKYHVISMGTNIIYFDEVTSFKSLWEFIDTIVISGFIVTTILIIFFLRSNKIIIFMMVLALLLILVLYLKMRNNRINKPRKSSK